MKSMLALIIAPALFAAAFMSSAAYAGDAAVVAPIHQFIDGVAKGDMASVKAAHVAAPVIIDNIPPHIWSGPDAFDTFINALVAAETAEGKVNSKLAIGKPIAESVTGDNAYVVVPSTYTYQQKGKTMREVGTMTFALVKLQSDWKIASWTWSSPEARPVKKARKKKKT